MSSEDIDKITIADLASELTNVLGDVMTGKALRKKS